MEDWADTTSYHLSSAYSWHNRGEDLPQVQCVCRERGRGGGREGQVEGGRGGGMEGEAEGGWERGREGEVEGGRERGRESTHKFTAVVSDQL